MNGHQRPLIGALLAGTCAVLIVCVLFLIVSTWGLASAIRESQKRTTGAVTDINRVSILAAACADKPAQQSTDDIYACVVQKLAEKAAK